MWLHFIGIDPLYCCLLCRTEHILRFQFHTGMVRTSVLRFTRAELDLACGDKRWGYGAVANAVRFPSDFFLDLGFHQVKESELVPSADEQQWWEHGAKGDGSLCFFDQARLLETKTTAIVAMVIRIVIPELSLWGKSGKRGLVNKTWTQS